MRRAWFFVLGVVAVAAVLFAVYFCLRSTPGVNHESEVAQGERAADRGEPSAERSAAGTGEGSVAGKEGAPTGGTQAGGKAGEGTKEGKPRDPFDYGRMPPVKANANPDVVSVAEALRNKTNPERLTPLIQPKPFDAEAYKQNKTKYLSTVEPGRVYQAAAPSKDTPRIRGVSPHRQTIAQGERVKLSVASAPSWPVAWTSFSGGQFSNQLNSITVEANDQGLAEVEYLATPGVIDDVHILCASPMASSQVRFVVHVTRPGGKE